MAKLVLLSAGMTGRTHELKADKTTIGRVEDNVFQIAEPSVSSHHCEILLQGNDVVVKDLNSTNGTFINGQKIEGEVRVSDGDTLQVGTLALSFSIGPLPNPEVPVQVVTESELKWLMDSPSDSFVLNPGQNTQVTEVPPEFFDHIDAAMTADSFTNAHVEVTVGNENRTISAGQLLRDYFKQSRL